MSKKDKTDEVSELLQNLFILEAVRAKMPSHEIRKILKININRVNAISKHVKQ